MLKRRRSRDRLIFNMGIPIPVKDGLYIETGPWWRRTDSLVPCHLGQVSAPHLEDQVTLDTVTRLLNELQ